MFLTHFLISVRENSYRFNIVSSTELNVDCRWVNVRVVMKRLKHVILKTSSLEAPLSRTMLMYAGNVTTSSVLG